MKLNKLLVMSVLFAIILPVTASAQSAKEKEGAAFYMCQQMLGTEAEAKACIDWLIDGTCQSTYQMRAQQFGRLLSYEKIQSYRIQAEQSLPDTCEPMSAIILNFDILNHLQIPTERTNRVLRILKWAEKLSPGQIQQIASDLSLLSDFPALIQNNDIRNFVLKTRDDAAPLDGVVPETTATFLRQLENTDPTLITPKTQALFFRIECMKGQYRSAISRLDTLDFNALDAQTKKDTIDLITASARKLFGESMFPKTPCYPEFRQNMSSDSVLAFFSMIYKNKPDPFIATHLTSRYLTSCDMSDAASTVFSTLKQFPESFDSKRNLDNLITYVDKTRSTQLLSAILTEASKLSGTTADYFRTKSAPKLIPFVLDVSRQALERGDAAWADALLTPMLEFGTARFEILLELGRAKQMLQNSAAARQYWAEIIEKAGKNPLTEKAFVLSILSFRQDAQTDEAGALQSRFENEYPASEWLMFLSPR